MAPLFPLPVCRVGGVSILDFKVGGPVGRVQLHSSVSELCGSLHFVLIPLGSAKGL